MCLFMLQIWLQWSDLCQMKCSKLRSASGSPTLRAKALVFEPSQVGLHRGGSDVEQWGFEPVPYGMLVLQVAASPATIPALNWSILQTGLLYYYFKRDAIFPTFLPPNSMFSLALQWTSHQRGFTEENLFADRILTRWQKRIFQPRKGGTISWFLSCWRAGVPTLPKDVLPSTPLRYRDLTRLFTGFIQCNNKMTAWPYNKLNSCSPRTIYLSKAICLPEFDTKEKQEKDEL